MRATSNDAVSDWERQHTIHNVKSALAQAALAARDQARAEGQPQRRGAREHGQRPKRAIRLPTDLDC